jgi:hypothetical protein
MSIISIIDAYAAPSETMGWEHAALVVCLHGRAPIGAADPALRCAQPARPGLYPWIRKRRSRSVSLSANGAPPCRTPHVRDAAGAARNLGAIFVGPCVPPAFLLPTPASSARNVPVRPLP